MLHIKLSSLTYISMTLTLISSMIFCLSPHPLFAQEWGSSPGRQIAEARSALIPEIMMERLVPPPTTPKRKAQNMQLLGMRLERPTTVVSTEYKRTLGNVIAVLKITVTDNDVTTANEERAELPEDLSIQGNYPNPFHTTTRILFNLPEPANVHVEVFDILGRVVYTSQTQQMDAGWDQKLSLDLPETSSGLYIYRVNVETASGRLVTTGRIVQIQ